MARLRLERVVRDIYGNRPKVGNKRTLFHKSVTEILKCSTFYLENWIRDVETAAKVAERKAARVRERNGSIRRYLVRKEDISRKNEELTWLAREFGKLTITEMEPD